MNEKFTVGRILLRLAGKRGVSQKHRKEITGAGVGLMITGMVEHRFSRPFERLGKSRGNSSRRSIF